MVAIHHREPALVIRAGHEAAEHIRQNGLNAADISLLPGAAGGPKGVGILGLDRAIFGTFLAQNARPRTLIGSSIGSWRFAAVASGGNDPAQQVAQLERLADLYTRQRFAKGMTPIDVSQQCRDMLDALLENKTNTLLSNPVYRLCVLACRSKGIAAASRKGPLLASLVGIVASNLVNRRALRWWMERGLFYPDGSPLPLKTLTDFTSHDYPLNSDNVRDVLMASASIPTVLEGVSHISNAPGCWRDGGLLDYHLDLPWRTDGIVLYPHFTNRITPGWFDKPLTWRQADSHRQRRTLLVAPSDSFLARLPNGKLPDRTDFVRYENNDAAREKDWRTAIAESDRLGDAWLELLEKQQLPAQLAPL